MESFLNQVHRSIAVSVGRIDSIGIGKSILYINGQEIPFPKTYKDDLRARFDRW